MSIKTSINIPWSDIDSSWRGRTTITTESAAYSRVPLINRAINLRVGSMLRVPVYVYPLQGKGKDKAKEAYRFEDQLPLVNLLGLTEYAMLLKGGSWTLTKANRFGFSQGLQWLNPFTMQWKYDKPSGQLFYWQQLTTGERRPTGTRQYWTIDDFVFFREFHPTNDLGPGISSTAVAMGDSKILNSVTNFMGDFFTADALPITMVMLPANVSKETIRDTETWFKNKITKIRNATARVLGLSGDVKVEKLTADLKTHDFPSIDDHAIRDISWAYGIPKTVLTSDSANFATASTEYRSFLDLTVVPRCRYIERVINTYLKQFNERIEFVPEELPEMQEDEEQRASSLKQLVDSGVPLDAALDILGYDLSEEAQASIDKAIREKEKRAEEFAKRPQLPSNGEQQPTNGDTAKVDLDKWMRKSLSSYRTGASPLVEFKSAAIPEKVQDDIIARLVNAGTETEIRDIFSEVSNGD